jgi:hypothetical protein
MSMSQMESPAGSEQSAIAIGAGQPLDSGPPPTAMTSADGD